MTEREQLQSDLNYVREAVATAESAPSPAGIYLLWAVLISIGFALADFARHLVGPFWTIAGPAGFLVSVWLGYRFSATIGQQSRSVGMRHLAHWFGLLVAIAASVPLGTTGAVEWETLFRFILLLLTFSYFLAGVHLDPSLRWIAGLMLLAYGGLFVLTTYPFTVSGLLIATGLVVAGLRARSRLGAAHAPTTG